jgi:hypothetical protein
VVLCDLRTGAETKALIDARTLLGLGECIMPARIIITGDRKWSPTLLVGRIVERPVVRYGSDVVVVHGDAAGIDRTFDASATLEIACHRSLAWSRRTLDCIQRCRRAGIRVYLFDSEDSGGRALVAPDLVKSSK